MNNRTLYGFYLEIQQMRGSVILHLLKPQAEGFLKGNQNRINHVIDYLNKLQQEFFEFDGDKIRMLPSALGQRAQAVYKPGKTKDEYQKLYNAFMDQKQMIVS